MMDYKGYAGQIVGVDDKQGIIHGELVGINDVVTFQGKTFEELVQAFHDSVDDYLAFCEERSEPPEKSFSGKFLLRIPPGLHQQAALAAKKAGASLNAWVSSAIKAYLSKATLTNLSPEQAEAVSSAITAYVSKATTSRSGPMREQKSQFKDFMVWVSFIKGTEPERPLSQLLRERSAGPHTGKPFRGTESK